MHGFYGPRHLLAVAASIITFPTIILWFNNIGAGWQKWYRRWAGSLYRTGGWLMLRKWTASYKKDGFLKKLAEAKKNRAATGSAGSAAVERGG
jgi:hypothetical protein